jgi:hypothetical protein
LVIHNQKDVKARRIIRDGVKDHLIPHLSGKTTAKDMWEALKSLFQSKNENRKMVLREKLRDTKMTGIDTVIAYLTRIRRVRDEPAAIGKTVIDSKLVRMALKGFTKQCTSFIKGIVARENLLDWSRLWDDFVQEELRDEELNGGRHKNDNENLALASQAKKGKFKKKVSGESTSQDDKKKDMSKVKCFACHKFGHYGGQCLNKKGGNETQSKVVVSAKTQIDEFAKKFEKIEFLLVSQTSLGTILASIWLIDSGSTCHMTGARYLFESSTESDSDVHVELDMGTKHAVKGSRTVPFRMESRGVLRVMDVLWVPKLRRSVLSVSMIEKKRFDVAF